MKVNTNNLGNTNDLHVHMRDPHRRRAALLKGPNFTDLHDIYKLNTTGEALDKEMFKARKMKIKVPHVRFPDGKDRTLRFKVNKERTEIRVEARDFAIIFITRRTDGDDEEAKGHGYIYWKLDVDDRRTKEYDNPYKAYIEGLMRIWDFDITDIAGQSTFGK